LNSDLLEKQALKKIDLLPFAASKRVGFFNKYSKKRMLNSFGLKKMSTLTLYIKIKRTLSYRDLYSLNLIT